MKENSMNSVKENCKIVAFVQPQLCERGTTNAMYDYALANEEICGNLSVIYYQSKNPYNHPSAIEKFKKRFTVLEFNVFQEVCDQISKYSIDYMYIIKYGNQNEYNTTLVPCIIHSVFLWDPHGIYACVSKSIATQNNGVWLPHIINPLPYSEKNTFRKTYGIPEDAYVYGRYGGLDTFSIEYTHNVIKNEIDLHPNIWFVFVNTNIFCDHPRVLFLPSIIDLTEKGDYVNACNAMVHGRIEGETFGLSIAEFITHRKPVLSCPASIGNDNEHLLLGKDWIAVYTNEEEFRQKLWNKLPIPTTENPYLEFSPQNVMKKFGELLGDYNSFT